MVVWDYPCESKSSPAHYSKHPNLKRGWGVFIARIHSIKNSFNKELFKYRTTNHFWMLTRFYGYNEEVFIFGVPVKINSFSPIPEDDEELPLPELIYWASLGDLEQVKQLLIDGEDPNQNDDEGYSALQAAAENDHLEIVKLLVEKGAHVTYKSEYTALQLAEMAGNTDIVNYLKVYKIKSPFYLKRRLLFNLRQMIFL